MKRTGFRLKPLRASICAAVDIFIVTASLQNDRIIRVALDAPHEPFRRFEALAKLALLSGDIDLSSFIGKITMKSAPFFAIIFIISYSEELTATEHPKIKNKIIGCATIDIRILFLDGENIFGLSRA